LRWRRPHGQHRWRAQGTGCPRQTRQERRRAYHHYVVTRRGVLYLLDVFAKSAKEDLTDAEKHEIRRLIAAIEAQA